MAFEMTLTIDKAGRVVIPKALRDRLHLQPGDELTVEGNDEEISMKPARSNGVRMIRKGGIWVRCGGERIPAELTDRILEELREERARLAEGTD